MGFRKCLGEHVERAAREREVEERLPERLALTLGDESDLSQPDVGIDSLPGVQGQHPSKHPNQT